jgi:transposase-like protein
MKKSRYTEEQVAFALRQAEGGTPVAEVCRQMGESEASFYVWKKKYGVALPKASCYQAGPLPHLKRYR